MTAQLLVTGANGTIGQALVAALQARGATFAVMSSRNAFATPAAPNASAAGASSAAAMVQANAAQIRTVQASFEDPASLAKAFAGVHTLFLLLPLVPHKLSLAANAVAAAKQAGVKHIVRSSGMGASVTSAASLERLQGQIDQLVIDSGIPFTLMRPASFMQNHITFNAAAIKAGTVYAPHGDAAYSMVDVRDIAEVAATVLLAPQAHAGRSYTLTSDEALSDAQQMAIISAALGRTVNYVDVPEAAAIEAMQGMGMPPLMVDWLMSLNASIKAGRSAQVTDDVARLTGRAARSFRSFVQEAQAQWQV